MRHTLKDLCEPVNETVDPRVIGTTTYVGMEHVDSGRLALRHTGLSDGLESAKARFRAGDVLYGKLRPYLDKAVVADVDGVCSTELLVLRPKPDVPGAFLAGLLHTQGFLDHAVRATHGVNHPRTSWQSISAFEMELPPESHWREIGSALSTLNRAVDLEDRLVAATRELKQAGMQQLFTRGLRGEDPKETEIGTMPPSWDAIRLGECCDVVSSSMSYTDFLHVPDGKSGDIVHAMGVKVSDMNRPGNEWRFTHTAVQKQVDSLLAAKKLIPADTVVFPKRGAAIATNKKRLTTTWTVLDPNLIGVRPRERVTTKYLFYWFQWFDLRSITEPGPTPQLNKKHLLPLLLPVPKERADQDEVVAILEAIDATLAAHERRSALLGQLFNGLLNGLMTGRLPVLGGVVVA